MTYAVGTLLRAKASMIAAFTNGETVEVAEGTHALVAEVLEDLNPEWDEDDMYELVHLPNGERSRWDEADMEAWHTCSAP